MIYLGSINKTGVKEFNIQSKPQPDFHGNFDLLKQDITTNSEKGLKTVIFCDNDGQEKRFNELLGQAEPHFNYELRVESIHQGFILPDINLALYTDHQIFNRYYRRKLKSESILVVFHSKS